jgi:single-stranded DNA-specific DHH superfamily exonuclease
MRPFGIGNREPKFMSTSLGVVNIKRVGRKNNHISLRLYDGDNFYKAIMFNGDAHEVCNVLETGDKVNIVYKLKKNEYRGTVYIDLLLEDIKYAAM